MHETHYFYLGQAESGAELQSIFCLSSSAVLIAHPLSRSAPFYPRSTPGSVPFGSVLNWSVPAPCRAVFRSFVRSFVHSFTRSLAHSFVRSFVQDGWLALPRATGICIRDPTICISIPRDSRYRCHRCRRRCQTAGTNINTNSRVHRLLYTAWRWRFGALVTPSYWPPSDSLHHLPIIKSRKEAWNINESKYDSDDCLSISSISIFYFIKVFLKISFNS